MMTSHEQMMNPASPQRRATHARGFSTIELLVVVAIIALLVGLGVAGFTMAFQSNDEKRTRVAIHQAMLAMTEYNTVTSRYISYTGQTPSNRPEDSMLYFVSRIRQVPTALAMLKTIDRELLVDDRRVNDNNATNIPDGEPDWIKDAWGTPLQYRLWHDGDKLTPADANPNSTIEAPRAGAGAHYEFPRRGSPSQPMPFIVSAGPDKAFGTDDDIRSYEIK